MLPDRRSPRSQALRAAADPRRAAHVADLTYVTDAAPGIRRRRLGRGFRYFGPDGRPVRDPNKLERIRLLEITLIRVGNEEYARDNASFGLTMLRRRHVAVSGEKVRFRFRGKSGKEHAFGIRDRRLSRIVKRCQELPGQELFRYVDDRGRKRGVGSADVNAYLRAVSGRDFTAKDFRTWAGTVRAAYALSALEPFSSIRQAKRNLARAVESVAARLGNTPAICRRCYIHPVVVDAYLGRKLAGALRKRVSRPRTGVPRPRRASVLDLLVVNADAARSAARLPHQASRVGVNPPRDGSGDAP